MSDNPIIENGPAAAPDQQTTAEMPPGAQVPAAEPVEQPVVPVPPDAAQQPARSSQTAAYAFAIAAAIVFALGLSAVSFGAGVFVGRTSNRFAANQQTFGRTMQGVPGMQGGQPLMPPGGLGNQGGGRDGYGQQGPHGRGGYGRGWQAPDGSTQLPNTTTPQAPTDQ